MLKWGTLAAITLSALGKFLLEELKLILTYLRLSKALQYCLLVNEDKWGIEVIDKVLKVIRLKKALGA